MCAYTRAYLFLAKETHVLLTSGTLNSYSVITISEEPRQTFLYGVTMTTVAWQPN